MRIEDLCGLDCWSYLLEGQRQELELLVESNKRKDHLRNTDIMQQRQQQHHLKYSLLDNPEEVLFAFRSTLQRNLLSYTESVHYALQINETEFGLGCKYLCMICNREIYARPRLSHKGEMEYVGVHCSSIFKHVRSVLHTQNINQQQQQRTLFFPQYDHS